MQWEQRRVSGSRKANCERCGKRTALRKSHAIPDAFFRRMKHARRGTVAKIHQDFDIRLTSESGWSYMLCDQCEMHFNTTCDEAGVEFVEKFGCQKSSSEIKNRTLAAFICSVLWRSQLSSAAMYSGYKITELDWRKLSSVILENQDPFQNFSFEVAQIYDDLGQISGRKLKQLLQPLTERRPHWDIDRIPYTTSLSVGCSSRHFIRWYLLLGICLHREAIAYQSGGHCLHCPILEKLK